MTTYRKFDWNRASSAFSRYFNDFFSYDPLDWTLTTTEAGAGSASEVITPGANGILLVTNDAADNDLDAFQLAANTGATIEPFKYVAGKKLNFVMRFKLSRVDGDFMAGLYITDTDPIGGVSDGIYFRKLAAEAGLSLIVEKNATETATVVITTLVADTWYEVEFYYDGVDTKIKAYVDGLGAGSAVLTNVPDDEELSIGFVIQNGSANVSTLSVDYIGCASQR